MQDKVAIITGGGAGIGRACAARFVKEGMYVVIDDISREDGEATARDLGVIYEYGSVADEAHCRRLAEIALERWGRIDAVVNSAGLNLPAMIRDLTPDILQQVAAVQFFGFYYFMRHIGNAQAASGGGSLINVTSATAILVPENIAAYSGCKAGINFVIKIAAREYGPDQVRVNALAPSFVPTAMNAYGGMTPTDDSHVEIQEELPIAQAFIDQTPLARIITVDECADVAVFLASDLSAAITGHVIPVDGGNHLTTFPSFGPKRRRAKPDS